MFVSSQEGSRREIPSTRVKEVDSDENTRHFWLAIARVEACCSNPAALNPVRTGPCSSAGLAGQLLKMVQGIFVMALTTWLLHLSFGLTYSSPRIN